MARSTTEEIKKKSIRGHEVMQREAVGKQKSVQGERGSRGKETKTSRRKREDSAWAKPGAGRERPREGSGEERGRDRRRAKKVSLA